MLLRVSSKEAFLTLVTIIVSDFLSMTTIMLFEVNAKLNLKDDINMHEFNKEKGRLK